MSVLVTVIWLVAMMNAINLVDGLDGLAAGIVAIAASAFFVYTYQIADSGGYLTPSAPLLAIIIVGTTLGFLRHNFYPAKIFMGDSGSMLLGLVLGGRDDRRDRERPGDPAVERRLRRLPGIFPAADPARRPGPSDRRRVCWRSSGGLVGAATSSWRTSSTSTIV